MRERRKSPGWGGLGQEEHGIPRGVLNLFCRFVEDTAGVQRVRVPSTCTQGWRQEPTCVLKEQKPSEPGGEGGRWEAKAARGSPTRKFSASSGWLGRGKRQSERQWDRIPAPRCCLGGRWVSHLTARNSDGGGRAMMCAVKRLGSDNEGKGLVEKRETHQVPILESYSR